MGPSSLMAYSVWTGAVRGMNQPALRAPTGSQAHKLTSLCVCVRVLCALQR